MPASKPAGGSGADDVDDGGIGGDDIEGIGGDDVEGIGIEGDDTDDIGAAMV
jgi:hypothetical protein